jgi:hypothetical protein
MRRWRESRRTSSVEYKRWWCTSDLRSLVAALLRERLTLFERWARITGPTSSGLNVESMVAGGRSNFGRASGSAALPVADLFCAPRFGETKTPCPVARRWPSQ